ncbi:MAG: acetyl-CoA carboxylase biotin carboxyl carrier protein [Sulfurospirillaceae bacterium]|nr:acetyl-CoA carboxylase biotin carboxyl carrier protein [Sulfurospirillaceae bacterium]MDD2826853.1 acetyl-CoA carboxylase biotin carboxyl carrier protein [Sulfurospirillaceae bacterium]
MDKNEIRELMRFFDKSDITKLKIKEGDFSIELQKGFENAVSYAATPVMTAIPTPPPASSPTPVLESTTKPIIAGLTLQSPMVGTFYKSPSPGAEAFAKVGDIVKKGHPIGIIEAMKIMNEIEAEYDCKIIESLVDDGQPVEFDMPLYVVEKV